MTQVWWRKHTPSCGLAVRNIFAHYSVTAHRDPKDLDSLDPSPRPFLWGVNLPRFCQESKGKGVSVFQILCFIWYFHLTYLTWSDIYPTLSDMITLKFAWCDYFAAMHSRPDWTYVDPLKVLAAVLKSTPPLHELDWWQTCIRIGELGQFWLYKLIDVGIVQLFMEFWCWCWDFTPKNVVSDDSAEIHSTAPRLTTKVGQNWPGPGLRMTPPVIIMVLIIDLMFCQQYHYVHQFHGLSQSFSLSLSLHKCGCIWCVHYISFKILSVCVYMT